MSELREGKLETIMFGTVLFLGGLGLAGVHMPKQPLQHYNGPIPERRQDMPTREVVYDDRLREKLDTYLKRLSEDSGSQLNPPQRPSSQFLKRHRHADSYQY